MSNKLELTWFDKEKEINVEPRILLENYELGYEKHPDGLLIIFIMTICSYMEIIYLH